MVSLGRMDMFVAKTPMTDVWDDAPVLVLEVMWRVEGEADLSEIYSTLQSPRMNGIRSHASIQRASVSVVNAPA